MSKKNPTILEKAIKMLLTLSTMYLREAEFYSYISLQTHHNRLNAEADMRIQLYFIKPDVIEIWKKYKAMPYPH